MSIPRRKIKHKNSFKLFQISSCFIAVQEKAVILFPNWFLILDLPKGRFPLLDTVEFKGHIIYDDY